MHDLTRSLKIPTSATRIAVVNFEDSFYARSLVQPGFAAQRSPNMTSALTVDEVLNCIKSMTLQCLFLLRSQHVL